MSRPVYLGMPTAPRGVGHLRGADPFPVAARRALGDSQLRRNLGRATATIRAKRAAVVAELPDWEELRAAGPAIKADAMAAPGPLSGAARDSRSPRAAGWCTGPGTRLKPTGS